MTEEVEKMDSVSEQSAEKSVKKTEKAGTKAIFPEVLPECIKCKSKKSDFWTRVDNGVECNDCQLAEVLKEAEQNSSSSKLSSQESGNGSTTSSMLRMPTRKSTRNTRNTRSKQNPYAYPRPVAPKGKGRRAMFKKTSYKAPTAVATPMTKDFVFYKGSYFQVGDIVSMRDVDGGVYYAQIRGLLQDQYCEKSAAVTWLLPTTASPHPDDGFDPQTYTLGMEEDLPRKLECMEFVMHAPSDYFRALNAPYPTIGRQPEAGFVWTSLRYVSRT